MNKQDLELEKFIVSCIAWVIFGISIAIIIVISVYDYNSKTRDICYQNNGIYDGGGRCLEKNKSNEDYLK